MTSDSIISGNYINYCAIVQIGDTMNNVNIKEMEKFVELISNDSSQAKKNKKVSGSWNFEEGKPQFVSNVEFNKGKINLNCELPPFAGGYGTSPDPIQYCLYGLAACFAVTFDASATKEGINLSKLDVTAENWMDLRKQMGVSKDNIIQKVKFTVHAEGASKDVLMKILKMTEERCPGTECVTRIIPLEIELK